MLLLIAYANVLLAALSIPAALIQAAMKGQLQDASRVQELLLRFIWLSAAITAVAALGV